MLNPPQTGTAGTQNVRSMGKLGDVKNISSREISFSGAAGDVSDVRSVGKQQQQTPQQPSSMKQVAGSSQLQSTFSDNISRSEYANINQFSNLHMGSPHRGVYLFLFLNLALLFLFLWHKPVSHYTCVYVHLCVQIYVFSFVCVCERECLFECLFEYLCPVFICLYLRKKDERKKVRVSKRNSEHTYLAVEI